MAICTIPTIPMQVAASKTSFDLLKLYKSWVLNQMKFFDIGSLFTKIPFAKAIQICAGFSYDTKSANTPGVEKMFLLN